MESGAGIIGITKSGENYIKYYINVPNGQLNGTIETTFFKTPIEKGQEIASIRVYIKEDLVKTIPVYAAEKVKKINFLFSLLTSFNYMIWGDA